MDVPGNQKVEEYHRQLLGAEFDKFPMWATKPLRKSIRLNPLRTCEEDFKGELRRMKAEPIPWCPGGFFVDPNEAWGATIPFQLGYYYLQEAASMIPAVALDAQEWEGVLDMAAAPGSKATQIAPMCKTIVANEPNPFRRKVLFANLTRCGVMNSIITSYDGTRFPNVKFDKVLLDAPCSNIGTARKDPDSLKSWSPKVAEGMAGLQKRLIRSAFNLLKPGGVLVYSTCTSTIEENEEVVLSLLDADSRARLENINMPLNSREGLLPGTEECLRIYPWDNDTEFFFVARISNG